MIKKIFSSILVLLIINAFHCPALALENNEKLYSNGVINAEFVTDLNVNQASKKQIVQFQSIENYTDKTGFFIPKGTVFTGKIHKFKKSRWGYRRAKVHIVIDEMRFPSGESYKIKAYTKRHVLKGSATGNIAKGIVTTPIALVVIVAGSVVMLVETVSIVGLIIVGPTGAVVRGLTGSLTKGINCTKNSGDNIKLKIIRVKHVPSTQKEFVQPVSTYEQQEIMDNE